jgi:hypothetical protein
MYMSLTINDLTKFRETGWRIDYVYSGSFVLFAVWQAIKHVMFIAN